MNTPFFKTALTILTVLSLTACSKKDTALDALLRDYPSIRENFGFDETKSGAIREMDIDFDGEDETVILVAPTFGIAVYENTENGWEESGRFADNAAISYISSLDELYPYEDKGEKYWYYSFNFDNGGVMTAEVIGAVKYDKEEYFAEYLLSHGALNLPNGGDFYRIGWNKGDLDLTQDHGDISGEEFRELWEKYPEAPEF